MRKNHLVLTMAILGLAVAGFVLFASQYNLNGLNPGDVYSQGLDVVRNEAAVETRLATVYGQEVIEARRLFRSAKLGPRQPRMQIAVLAPRGAFVNGSGFRSEYGEDHSVLREIMWWGVMRTEHDLNNTVRKTLTWECDGRKQEVRIEGQSFPLSDGNRFVVQLDKDWKPAVYQVNLELNIPPYLKGKEDELRKFFNLDHAKAGVDLSADDFHRRFVEICPPTVKITRDDVTYHGKVNSDTEIYHLVGYLYSWEVLPGSERGHGKLLVFDADRRFIGCYEVYGAPEITIEGTRVKLHYPDETRQNQRTWYDFAHGVPKTDENQFGFNFVTPKEMTLHHAMGE